jgi:hypothetical protein
MNLIGTIPHKTDQQCIRFTLEHAVAPHAVDALMSQGGE